MEALVKSTLVIALLLLGSYGLSSEVLDLGRLEVEGEVRKPNIDFIMSEKVPLKVLKQVSEGVFEDFEARLLKSDWEKKVNKND